MEFQGFQTTISSLTVIILVAGIIGVSFLTYRKQNSLGQLQKASLITLRASALLILLLMLLNPFFFSVKEKEQKPKLIYLFDNSESVSLIKGTYSGSESANEVIRSVIPEDENIIDIELYQIGTETRPLITTDSLNYKDNETNLINAIKQIQELEDQFDGAVLISDGIITYGKNPVIEASNLTIPMYTIGLGDTSTVRDISINNLITNSTGYTNSNHFAEVQILNNGFSGERTSVTLRDSEGSLIEQKQISFEADNQLVTVDFEIELEKAGLTPFIVDVTPVSGEWSTENNSTSFTVDVIDSKIRILHVASEIHPDVKTLRAILSTDLNIELQTITLVGNRKVAEERIDLNQEFDAIIVHDEIPDFLGNQLSDLKNTSTILMNAPVQFSSNNNRVSSSLSLASFNGANAFNLDIKPNSQVDHPVLEIDELNYNSLPPLSGPLQINQTGPQAVPLFTANYQGIESQIPVILIAEEGNVRRAHVTVWNWFKIHQSTNEDHRLFTTQLFTNLISWVSTTPDDRLLRINPSKNVFQVNETVVLNASLINESGEPENNGSIELTVEDSEQNVRSYNMKNIGSGSYTIDISNSGPGIFSYNAIARKNNREIDDESGEFIVQRTNTEYIQTVRNERLLKDMAEFTGGQYMPFNESDELLSQLNDDGLLEKNTVLTEVYSYPVRTIYWFLLVLALLTSEWLLRKRFSLP